jgi:uncharacterized membrane protein
MADRAKNVAMTDVLALCTFIMSILQQSLSELQVVDSRALLKPYVAKQRSVFCFVLTVIPK